MPAFQELSRSSGGRDEVCNVGAALVQHFCVHEILRSIAVSSRTVMQTSQCRWHGPPVASWEDHDEMAGARAVHLTTIPLVHVGGGHASLDALEGLSDQEKASGAFTSARE